MGAADKDVRAVVTSIKDVKENMLLMNKKVTYFKETLKKRNSRTEK